MPDPMTVTERPANVPVKASMLRTSFTQRASSR